MTKALIVLRQAAVKPIEWMLPAHGRHRLAVARPAQASLDDLLGPWPQPVPERALGAAVTQAWRDCEPCDKTTAGVLHKDGWTCGECLTSVTVGGAS